MEKHANIDLVRWFVSAQMVCYKFLNSYTKVEWKTKKMVEVKEKVFLLKRLKNFFLNYVVFRKQMDGYREFEVGKMQANKELKQKTQTWWRKSTGSVNKENYFHVQWINIRRSTFLIVIPYANRFEKFYYSDPNFQNFEYFQKNFKGMFEFRWVPTEFN